MIENGGKGSSTKTGLKYEFEKDFIKILDKYKDFSLKPKNSKNNYYDLFYKNSEKLYGFLFKKNGLYLFLQDKNIDWKKYISKKLLPDQAVFLLNKKTINIIEIKYQQVAGSVDEKLQTCDFKKKQYQKLFKPLNLRVEYIYLLNDWFKDKQYKDVLEYIKSVNCNYYFDEKELLLNILMK